MSGARFNGAELILSLMLAGSAATILAATAPGGNQSTAAARPAAQDSARRFALLVGCTKYDNNRSFRLVGPGNDVELLRTVLVDKFKFPAENIVVLSEKVGGRFRPTHDDIAREFAELAKKSGSGDQVVVLLGGHGSQQPEQNPPDLRYPKPNGRDQIFLPADIGIWNGGKQQSVVNAIPDHELRKWTKAVTATGASLWLIVDSCCSGATLRGDETPRKVSPEDLAIPESAFAEAADRARQRGGTRGGGDEPAHLFELDEQSPNFVALYAARPDEPTVERPFPIDGENQQNHGLLTYTVCEILERAAGDLTYAELHKLICDRYTQMGRTTGPKPLIEGLAREREVFGTAVPGRSQFNLLQNPSGGWKLNAGRLQGLTAGSILAVYPPRDRKNADQAIGHVRIKLANTLDSTVVPYDYGGLPTPAEDDLVPGARCELVYMDYGALRLKMAVDKLANARDKKVVAADLIARLEQADRELRELAGKPGALFMLVDRGQRPDWVVQARGKEIVLLSADAADIEGDLPAETPRFVVPARSAAKALAEYTSHIFRAQNLLNLTSPGTQIHRVARDANGLATDATAIDVEVEMLKLRDENDTQGTPIRAEGHEVTVPAGQWVAWRINNHSHFKIDVTLLFVDSEFGILSAFPRAGSGTDNMITPGGHILTGQATTTPTTYNLDQMVVIATKSEGQPIDFSVLEQSNLAAVRGALRGAGDPTLDSPLGQLCQNALYGTGGTRGLEMKVNTHQMYLMSWRVK
ncbi:MAG TPA: caspase family protein [Pirellulales bacterium]|nr:caspase family protein [Pirellulales bacterium]